MELLGLLGLLFETVYLKAPPRGLSPCHPSVLITYLSALLGHRKGTPFGPSNCIYKGKGVCYRLVLYYFNGFKVIYKYAECKFLKDYVL